MLALHCDPVWDSSKDRQQVFKNQCHRNLLGWLSEAQGVTPSHVLEKCMSWTNVWTTCTRKGTDVIMDSFAEPEVEACY